MKCAVLRRKMSKVYAVAITTELQRSRLRRASSECGEYITMKNERQQFTIC
jgi:hypothetical protein